MMPKKKELLIKYLDFSKVNDFDLKNLERFEVEDLKIPQFE
jgi:hypothetical protein